MAPLIQTLKGFRDFLPQEKRARDFVAGKIKETFERFGFEPLETPTLEYADLLLGKYGTEADKLVYTFEDKGGRRVGLRYDQTVPTARVLAQYQNELPKYFRRYQIQNVFRADKPQQGRYREFTQCDIDIVGSRSPVADAEILACAFFAYKNIGFPSPILVINDRNTIINTLTPYATDQVSVFSLIQTIDKADKIGQEGVVNELVAKGLTPEIANQALAALSASSPSETLSAILKLLPTYGIGDADYRFSPTTARGLDYYTDMIFEVQIPNYPVGSVGGGGRYDNLINDLGGPDIPAVGMAFGFDRTVEAAQQLNLIPATVTQTPVLIAALDDSSLPYALTQAQNFRSRQIPLEVYPAVENNPGKILSYANRNRYQKVILVGSNEAANNTLTLKNMVSGEQKTDTLDNLLLTSLS